ncbi:MAG: choice-of-anchor B family protein [Rhodothermales bacterium]
MRLRVTCLLLLAGFVAGPVRAQVTNTRVTGRRVACAGGVAAGFDCASIDLLAFLPLSDLGDPIDVNDLWGWTDPETGSEYALVGHRNGLAIVDITDPVNPAYLGELPSHTSDSIWRDVKTYRNYAFVVSEARIHGMQVFDLTQLRAPLAAPVRFQETAYYDGIGKAHNIVINEESGFAYVVGGTGNGESCNGGLHMVDIRDPEQPSFAGCYSEDGYTHDAQCVIYRGPDADYQGREICMAANEDTITIVDVTRKTEPVQISRVSYPNVGYVHQGWLTEDHRYFVLNDELDELQGKVESTRTLIWDFADLDDPHLLKEYLRPTTSVDHNLYIVGHYVFQANFTSGLRILDISDIEHPREVAFFDTYPHGDVVAPVEWLNGAWSTYPFFESGVVIVGSIKEGLFVLKPADVLVHTEQRAVPDGFTLSPAFPNPFNSRTSLTLTVPVSQRVTVAVYDVLGRKVKRLHEGVLPPGTHSLMFEASGLPGGAYIIRATGAGGTRSRFVMRAK